MKKTIPYILSLLFAGAILFLVLTGNKTNRRFDERITLRKQDKLPYGTWVAYKNLGHLFPNATIYTNRHEPGYWDSLSNYTDRQALIIITSQFQASEAEMKRIISFAEHGNDVFISTRSVSDAAEELIGCRTSVNSISNFFIGEGELQDSMSLLLNMPPFEEHTVRSYPGHKYDGWFYKIDSFTTSVLGTDGMQRADFIRLRSGNGNVYLQLAPLAFSNYFLLHGGNIGYYENALSVINPAVKRVVWDEYYLNKKNRRDDNRGDSSNWLAVLFRHPALKAALLTAILTILLFVLLEMRRKQRPIPVITKPKNDSLDFVRTIGRLYYDKGDHRNLCRKMAAYFLEHVRNQYKLPTGTLDNNFINQLQFKSGVDETEISRIVTFIKYAEDAPAISQAELVDFHRQLESFYKKT